MVDAGEAWSARIVVTANALARPHHRCHAGAEWELSPGDTGSQRQQQHEGSASDEAGAWRLRFVGGTAGNTCGGGVEQVFDGAITYSATGGCATCWSVMTMTSGTTVCLVS